MSDVMLASDFPETTLVRDQDDSIWAREDCYEQWDNQPEFGLNFLETRRMERNLRKELCFSQPGIENIITIMPERPASPLNELVPEMPMLVTPQPLDSGYNSPAAAQAAQAARMADDYNAQGRMADDCDGDDASDSHRKRRRVMTTRMSEFSELSTDDFENENESDEDFHDQDGEPKRVSSRTRKGSTRAAPIVDPTGILPPGHRPARGRGRQVQLQNMSRAQIVVEAEARLERNRQAARECRQRRKQHVHELQARISDLERELRAAALTIKDLRTRVSFNN